MPHGSTWRLTAAGAAVVLLAGGMSLATTSPAAAATCASSVPGDVNGDGHAEVAVSENGSTGKGRGAVHVFYGKTSGLVAKKSGSALDDQYLDQATSGVPGTSEDGDGWGGATAFGDFDHDGCADLAVGVPGENGGEGAVTVLYGSKAGLTAGGSRTFTLSALSGAKDNAGFGATLAVGDLDHDGVDDLAVGAPRYSAGGDDDAGVVAVLYGDAQGLGRGSTAADLLSRDTPGVPGEPTDNDWFGNRLATGDFNGDGTAELAVGLYADGEGALQTLQRGATGYTGPQPALITRSTTGVPQTDPGDEPGNWVTALAAGDLNGDGRDDVVVGDPDEGCLECDEEYGYGSVTMLPGSATGLTGVGSTRWTQDSPGVVGTATPDDGFGYSLAIGPLDGDAIADLAIGTPSDEGYVGSVTLLRGSSSGLTTAGTGGSLYDQATPGIAGSRGPNSFGATLTTAYVQSDDQASLVVGAYSETVGKVRGAGRIVQLSIQSSGPKASTSRSFTLDTAGVRGKSSKYAGFGFELS